MIRASSRNECSMNQDWVNDWYCVGTIADVPLGAVIQRQVGPGDLALFNLDGDFFARENACGKCGQPLSNGTVRNSEVECAGCGFRIPIARESDTFAAPLYPIMIVDDEIFVLIKNANENSQS